MPDIKEILAFLEKLAPSALAEPWDNVGLLVENEGPVTGVLTALDITDAVLREAQTAGCNLIVAHHPVIFTPLKKLSYNSIVYKMVRAGVAGICMHTNLDCAEGGTGDTLAGLLSLSAVRHFTADGDEALGRLGRLPQPLSARDFAALCARTLGVPVRFTDCETPVETVAIVTGAGGFVADALSAGAQALLTGEVKHHEALAAHEAGFCVVEAGHYATEVPVASVLARRLREAFPDLPVQVSGAQRDPLQPLRP